ncbi:MAG: protein kinase [Polyangiales bacterium]
MATEPFLLQHLKPHDSGPAVLNRAAESIALNKNVGTIVDVIHGRAFRYYAEGLQQYLTIRSGSAEFARTHMAKLRAFVAKSESTSLVAPPGIRARLYRAARSYVKDAQPAIRRPNRNEIESLPWRASPAENSHDNPLRALRIELNERDSELLELRYARELSVEELAFVINKDVQEIANLLDQARSRAELLIDEHQSVDDKRFRRLIIEAFALQPQAPHQDTESDTASLPTGTVIGGRYAVQARVGLGAFGDVYRAQDTEVPGHVVALKLLHQAAFSDAARQTALRELRLIASVFHPSVVQFKDHGWHEGRLWFVMPWYEGETLESRIQRERSTGEALTIFQPLARALAAMHAAGVRHQDVKPDNIFLARIPGFGKEEILPVLLDLGVAATDAEMVVAGTPTYFAPEVAAQFASVPDKPTVTPRADVFALALSLRNALEPIPRRRHGRRRRRGHREPRSRVA